MRKKNIFLLVGMYNKKVKLPLLEAMKARREVRRRGSHIF
jgi:hypothetical protein